MLRGRPGATLEGPVGIARGAADASTAGLDALLSLLAAISVALAVFNLLPIPGLDGGRLLLLGIAGVRGKPIDPRLEALTDYVEDSGEGRWTIQEAIDAAVPLPVISAALFARFASRQESSPAMRAVAALRQQFGGHAVHAAAGPSGSPGEPAGPGAAR